MDYASGPFAAGHRQIRAERRATEAALTADKDVRSNSGTSPARVVTKRKAGHRAADPGVHELAAALPRDRRTHAAVLLAFAILFSVLEVVSYRRESATWDEPVHVMDGYLSLTARDFRADIEHPPLLRMWAAIPLLGLGIKSHPERIDPVTPSDWALNDLFVAAHDFLYVDNDADAMLYRSRFMIVILGIVLGCLMYLWADSLFGWFSALGVLALYTFEPNLDAHAQLVTTDLPVTLGIFASVYYLWRVLRAWRTRDIIFLCLFTTLAVLVKFSGLLLGPILTLLLVAAVVRRRVTWSRALILAAVLAATTFVGIWACYGFRYLPSSNPNWRFAFHEAPFATEIPLTSAMVRWVDERHLLPNAYAQGFLLNQARSQHRKAFLAGNYTETGWWYYFPAAFALKTPVVLLLLIAGGAWSLRRFGDAAWYLLTPVVVVFGVAMTSHINIGVRHILPVYPFVVVMAGAVIHELVRRRRAALAAGLVAAGALEPALVYPHSLAFFNALAGGPAHGADYLSDSNLDWGQDLKGLKAWLDEYGINHVNLAYFGSADPRYYGISCTFLPGSPGWVSPAELQLPRLPGYVAVSVTLLNGVYAPTPLEREFYARLARRTPVASIGHSINVYRVDEPWWLDLRPR